MLDDGVEMMMSTVWLRFRVWPAFRGQMISTSQHECSQHRSLDDEHTIY